ncbi:hypothetical protein WM15_02340 [Burkholderia ubonensis]|nr:hypothetical protein WM15_02340 [Burkholderia ubonensis]
MEVGRAMSDVAHAGSSGTTRNVATDARRLAGDGMLRTRLIQHWFGVDDLAREVTQYGNTRLCCFVGVGLSCEAVPDAMLEFKQLLKQRPFDR